MIYLLNFIIFSLATLLICSVNDITNIKTERRIGIAKKPWILLVRHVPGYFNFIPHVLILFIATTFACYNMSLSREHILVPLILIFVTKLFSPKRRMEDIYFETVAIAAIIISMLPVLLDYRTISWLSFIPAAICVKIFNRNLEEPLPLNSARELALNCYILSAFFPQINFNIYILLAMLLTYIQNTICLLVPKFNNTKNMRIAFAWTLLMSLLIFILGSVLAIYTGGR